MRASALLVLLAIVACSPPRSPGPRTSRALECPPGTRPQTFITSDQGWAYPGEGSECERGDGVPEGPAIILYEGAEGRGPTRFVGRYSHGTRVGEWKQYDERTGMPLGGFVLDMQGNGVEEIRDQLGRVLGGNVVADQRDGTWTYRDHDGTVVATEVYDRGKFVRRAGKVPWDPPMMDPRDECPVQPRTGARPADDDGCPDAAK